MPDNLALLEGWARDGQIDAQIAARIGISASTLYEWKRKYPKIAEALANGKEVVDIKVENALLKRALGYTYEETRKEGTPRGVDKVSIVTKHMPPDVTAQIFWLKNRKPEVWREKVEAFIASDEEAEDALSRSLREMAEALKSDAVPGTNE